MTRSLMGKGSKGSKGSSSEDTAEPEEVECFFLYGPEIGNKALGIELAFLFVEASKDKYYMMVDQAGTQCVVMPEDEDEPLKIIKFDYDCTKFKFKGDKYDAVSFQDEEKNYFGFTTANKYGSTDEDRRFIFDMTREESQCSIQEVGGIPLVSLPKFTGDGGSNLFGDDLSFEMEILEEQIDAVQRTQQLLMQALGGLGLVVIVGLLWWLAKNMCCLAKKQKQYRKVSPIDSEFDDEQCLNNHNA